MVSGWPPLPRPCQVSVTRLGTHSTHCSLASWLERETAESRIPGQERETHLVDRDPRRGAFKHLGHKRQVLKGGVIVIEVQEVHKHRGTAGGSQRGYAT